MRRYRTYIPVLAAFIGSLLLSLIALYCDPILGRDSALYVDIASIFSDEGFARPAERFDWPWLSLMIALVHKGTGLSLITSGHLLMAFMMAGTCALLTRATQLLSPNADWWGCLASLSIPAFNAYRDAILREPGFWMFTALGLVSIGLWSKRSDRRSLYLVIAACSIILAMSFRLEAVFLFGALGCSVVFQYTKSASQRRKRWPLYACLCLLLVANIIYLEIPNVLQQNVRIGYYLELLSPSTLTSRLDITGALLAEQVLEKYSRNDAELILLFGFLGVILFTSIKLLGPFVVTLAFSGRAIVRKPVDNVTVFIFAALLLYLLVLMIFFIQQNFMIDRYTALFHILATPLVALSAWQFQQRFPIGGKVIAVIAILLALSNVISFSDNRTHYLSAGEWINQNIPTDRAVYYTDGRISFYAGRRYLSPGISEEQAIGPHFESYDYFVLESSQVNPPIRQRLESGELELLSEFSNGKRHQLIVLGKPNAAQN